MCDNVPDLIWAKDLDRRFLFTNKAVCEKLLLARDTEEPVGKDDMFFVKRARESHPDNTDWHTFGEVCTDSDAVVMSTQESQRFDEFGNEISQFKHSLRTSSVGFNQLNIIFRNLFCNSTMMMRVTKQRFNAEFPPAEDFEYWSRMILIEKLHIINLPYIFVKYRIHSSNTSSKNPSQQLLLNDKIVTRNIHSQNNFTIKNLNNLAINHHLSETFTLKIGFIIYIIQMISFYKLLYRVRTEFDINFFEYIWTLIIDLNYRVRALIKHLLRSAKR
jgi:hypothetical protein